MTSSDELSARRRRAIVGLCAGLSKQAVAADIGVKPRTISRYLRDPLFRAQLAQAQDGALSVVVATMTAGARDMLAVLRAVANDAHMPAGVRVRASIGWLTALIRTREHHDVIERLIALEERFDNEHKQ